MSSLVAVSGQQCSQEFLLTQPTSPGPLSLERGASLQPGRRPGFSASWQGVHEQQDQYVLALTVKHVAA